MSSLCAIVSSYARRKCPPFKWALLFAIIGGHTPAFGDTVLNIPTDPEMTLDAQNKRAFTTFEINTVLRLIDRAKQRIDPEYYLSDEYRYETSLETQRAKRLYSRQQTWRQATQERQRIRKELTKERIEDRQRLAEIRTQERHMARIQRKSQLQRQHRQHCMRQYHRVVQRNKNLSFRNGPLQERRSQPACS